MPNRWQRLDKDLEAFRRFPRNRLQILTQNDRAFLAIQKGCEFFGLDFNSETGRQELLEILAVCIFGGPANELARIQRGPRWKNWKRDQKIVARLKALQEKGNVIPSMPTKFVKFVIEYCSDMELPEFDTLCRQFRESKIADLFKAPK